MTVARMPHWFAHDANKHYKCTVRYLDDSSWETTYFKNEDSQKLFDRICDHLNLIEKDYFGLRFVDEKKQRRWLDLGKDARKQLKKAGKDLENVIVCFRVKFYPPDPVLRIHEELTLYQLFLQLRRDLQHGRLYGSSGDEAVLVACILQSELSNLPAGTNSVPEEYRCLMKHGKKGESKALEQWNQLRGYSATECERRFIEQAARLDTFGIDPHPVKNDEDQQVFIGYNHFGIIAFQGAKKIMHLDWAHILKMSYEGRTFLVHYVKDSKKNTKGMKCSNAKAAKHLWRNALETKIFFTSPTSKNLGHISNGATIFSRASRIRFSGRVAREAMEKSAELTRPGVAFHRAAFAHKPDADVYEGVVATPALHRRASLFPMQKEPISETTPEEPVTPELPASVEIIPAEPHPDDNLVSSPTPQSKFQPEEPVSPPEPVSLPDRPLTSTLLKRTKNQLDDSVDEILRNGGDGLYSGQHSERNVFPPIVPPREENKLLSKVAVVALAAVGVLGIYTLFETNWLSSDITDVFIKPLQANIYEPVKDYVLRWWQQ